MDDLKALREFRADMPAAGEPVRARTMAVLRTAIDSERVMSARAGSIPRRARWQVAMTRPRLRLAAVAAVTACAVALLLVAPWQGGGGLVERALAAVGHGAVLHVVTEQSSPSGYYQPVSLTTGQPIPTTLRQEVWFDQGRDLKKTISTLNGTVIDELLESREGGFTRGGAVFTCAWIAAHPIEATKARVSCNPNMQNGTTSKEIPEQPPTLELALAGFLDHYRSALASGQAREIGEGELDGHKVIWLRIAPSGVAEGLPPSEDVAIDADSYVPLLVRTSGSPSVEFRVAAIDTQPYDPALFTPPAIVHAPSSGEVVSTSAIDPARTPSVLAGRALWLGRDWQGLRLVSTMRQDLTTGYGSLSGFKPTQSRGVVFEYARVNSDGTTETKPTLRIRESTRCEPAYVWPWCDARAPSGDTMLVGLPFNTSIFQRDGLYISISQTTSQPTPVQIADALRPVPGSKPQ